MVPAEAPREFDGEPGRQVAELLKFNLKAVRSYLLREDFQRFWEYCGAGWGKRFLAQWCTRTMRSKIEPMKKVARTLGAHEPLISNWFRAKGALSSGAVEGLNNKVKLTMRESSRVSYQRGDRTRVIS